MGEEVYLGLGTSCVAGNWYKQVERLKLPTEDFLVCVGTRVEVGHRRWEWVDKAGHIYQFNLFLENLKK